MTIGANQPEYLPLPAQRRPDGTVTSFWKFSPEELEAIYRQLEGIDRSTGEVGVYVSQLTFGKPLQPVIVSMEPPPPCFEAKKEEHDPLAMVKDAVDAQQPPTKAAVSNHLASISHMRTKSLPYLFAMDAKSVEGKVICHMVSVDTQVFDANADFDPGVFQAISPQADPRLQCLADTFTEPQAECVLAMFKCLGLAKGNLEVIARLPALPRGLRESVVKTVQVIMAVAQKYG